MVRITKEYVLTLDDNKKYIVVSRYPIVGVGKERERYQPSGNYCIVGLWSPANGFEESRDHDAYDVHPNDIPKSERAILGEECARVWMGWMVRDIPPNPHPHDRTAEIERRAKGI